MNQILRSSWENEPIPTLSSSAKPKKKISSLLQYQFYASVAIAILSIFIFYVVNNAKAQKEQYSQDLLQTYQIATLYSTNTVAHTNITDENTNTAFIIGAIRIDKIRIHYPILSSFSEENLKIAPCRFSGPLSNEIGNLCIAGHNYVDTKFFSRLDELQLDDTFWIYDLKGNGVMYKIYKKYEVSPSDLSCLENTFENKCEVTLITCNNVTGNRLVVKGIEIV